MTEAEFSPGFLYIWHLATMEAQSASSAEITPDHFVLALCSFGEMPVDVLQDRLEGIRLQQEAEDVRGVFRFCGLALTRFWHRLRTQLGESGERPLDGVWHRSEEAKTACKLAAEFARERGRDCPEAIHLLWALARQQAGAWAMLLNADGFSLKELEAIAAKTAADDGSLQS